MTLEEIADSLPNGFHDAQINSITINYVKREMSIVLEIWVAEGPEDSEEYRPAELKVLDFLFCVIEAPDARYTYHERKALWVDAGSGQAVLRSPAISCRSRYPKPHLFIGFLLMTGTPLFMWRLWMPASRGVAKANFSGGQSRAAKHFFLACL
jgi:hypothetical protein